MKTSILLTIQAALAIVSLSPGMQAANSCDFSMHLNSVAQAPTVAPLLENVNASGTIVISKHESH